MSGRRRIAILTGILLAPGQAQAHLMNTGLGPFYDGVAHLFVTPEDLLPLLAAARFSRSHRDRSL